MYFFFFVEGPFINAEGSSIFDSYATNWGPLLAIDGKISSTRFGFFHSLIETDPWLKVTAKETLYVLSVTVTHRLDCCQDRFQNARAILINTNGNEFQCGDTFVGRPSPADTETTFQCGTAIPANSIKITLQGNNMALQVNEITVTHPEGKIQYFWQF